MNNHKTLAEALEEEEKRLALRFLYYTRPKRPLTMEEARALCAEASKIAETPSE